MRNARERKVAGLAPVTRSLPVRGSPLGAWPLRHKQPLLFPQGPPGSSQIPDPILLFSIHGATTMYWEACKVQGTCRLVKHSFCPQEIWSPLRTTHSRVWWGQGGRRSDPSLYLILSSASFTSHSREIPDMFSPGHSWSCSINTCVCFCLSGAPKWREGKGKLKGSVLFPMSIVSTCQISGKFRRAICLLEGRARPQRGWGPRCALASIWEEKKFSTRSSTSWVVESEEGKPIIPGRRRK